MSELTQGDKAENWVDILLRLKKEAENHISRQDLQDDKEGID